MKKVTYRDVDENGWGVCVDGIDVEVWAALTDNEKSVLLAKAMGWEVDPRIRDNELSDIYYLLPDGEYYTGAVIRTGSDISAYHALPDLYSPANMALAWRVLNWAGKQLPTETVRPGFIIHSWAGKLHSFWGASHWVDGHKLFLHSMKPATAQRAWLDEVLSLAIEAGLIEVDE